MDITRKTLQSSLPLLRQAIKTCDFIAVDTELSGLHRVASEGPHGSDTAQVRYEKLKASSQAFAILQFGVATFTWDSTIKKYVVRSFNFPVFPQAGKQILGLDRRFLVESSAVDFLLSTGFNFDNTFKTGIPYVRFDEEEIAKANIDKIENASNSNVIPLDHTNRDFVETAMTRVQEWLDNSTEPFISIIAENGFKKRLIHQEIRLRFNSTLSTRSRHREIIVSKMSDAERERILNGEDEQKAKLLGELDYLVGFRRVIELISKSEKPLIGHNMYLDLCQTIQKFCFELPLTVGEFKSLCHSVFPVIYDTKHIANTDKKIKDLVTVSALSEMVSQLSSEPFSKPEFVMHPDFHDYLSSSATERFHEAGYDAFSTGVAFAKMMYHIADVPEGEPLDLSPPIEAQTEPVSTTRYHLNRFENKLNVMRSDEPILNLVGDEDPIDRSNVMYLANFPTSWKTHTIVSLCQPHVGHSFVRWINDTSCFVQVADRNRVLDHVAINAIKVAILSKRILDKEEPSGAGALPLRVMLHEEFVAVEEELKAEEKAAKEDAKVLPLQGKKRSRSEVEADVEDGEILDEDDGTIDVEPAAKLKRQKSDSSCNTRNKNANMKTALLMLFATVCLSQPLPSDPLKSSNHILPTNVPIGAYGCSGRKVYQYGYPYNDKRYQPDWLLVGKCPYGSTCNYDPTDMTVECTDDNN
ncbi:hypothetical protein HDU79_011139 [Rhizoclosmatium sp. JEL0117]|nr:hypothetical protein HDU79_011139 [Rhizoclosmatium sp. JEL0117]